MLLFCTQEDINIKVQTLKYIRQQAEAMIAGPVYTGGWIRTIRQSKNIAFIELHDGTTVDTTQLIITKDTEAFADLKQLTTGSCIRVKGDLAVGLSGKQTYEIVVRDLFIEGIADSDFPLQKKEHSLEFLRTIPQLRARTQTFNIIFRLRSILTEGLLAYLKQADFIHIQAPAITSTDAEGGGEVFRITSLDPGETDLSKDFFGEAAYLSVTGQLNLETFIGAFRNIYTFGPSFRAEHSNTNRHVAEFWQIEPEMAFVDLNDLMDTIEAMTQFTIKYVLEQAPEELRFCEARFEPGLIDKLKQASTESYARITYTEAMRLLSEQSESFTIPVNWDEGLASEHERYLSDVIFKKPVFVTDYPKELKAFYMRLNDDGKTVGATDLLFPKIGEIVGASEREERHDCLLKQIHDHGLDLDTYQWYLDTRRFATVRHGGFGIGLERFLRYVSGVENIRDVIAYPRTPNSIQF